ncbi:hypothetical protein NDI44_15155 [Trichocoleus sp. DQ-A3]|uniref:hypothetical protein n=1 Tax=Cyanophyceae TaxID=3028117 RepID=UPI001684B541|nr:hypothetical protein [Coleofasciculus sp. FACHB-125]MBD1900147.1 hypothetical protein [Coleofasciculus sp. FACHB-125]
MLGWIFGGFIKKLERASKDVSQDFVKSAGKQIGELFDEKLYPLADKLDYIAQNRINQAKNEMEELETKTVGDIESLINQADEQVKKALENINQVREVALRDVRETIGITDTYLENRINQISLVVMEALQLGSQFTPEEINNKLIAPMLVEVNLLEEKLFKDANQLVDKIDEAIDGKLEQIRNELKKHLAHALPNPFDKCRQRLKIGLKPGARLSDIELYELSECYELSKLNEKSSIDEVLKIYGQLQHNAAMMAALVKKAPELKRIAIQDWLKYGVLCEFWRGTIKTYDSTEPLLLKPEKSQRFLTDKEDT